MSLAHQNIVPVFDFGRIDDQVFIAMERVEGKDLGSTLSRGGALQPLLAAFMAAECCQALDYAHLRRGPDGLPLGIVHRDVTPRNVMLSWSGEVKLTDFGIASLAGDAAAVIGTPGYMAPEQARGEAIDPRADIYAVGMVLREALTGVRPRPGGEREATLAAARAGTLVPWPEGFSSPLVAIVDRATAVSREDRFPDARAMLEALDGYIVGERAANKSDAPTRRLAAWLAEIWNEEREELAIDEAIEGSHLVSFLDDGALDAIGTGTERSMQATAADEAPVVPPPAPVIEVPAKRRRWIVPVAGLVVVVAAGALAIKSLGPRAVSPRDAALAAVPVVQPDAATAIIPAVVVDAAVAITADAAPPDAGQLAELPRHPKNPTTVITPPLPLHAVRVNVKPGWAYFTVDDNATQYQTPDTIHLAVGAHTVHFTHGTITRATAITVPDSDALTVLEDLSH